MLRVPRAAQGFIQPCSARASVIMSLQSRSKVHCSVIAWSSKIALARSNVGGGVVRQGFAGESYSALGNFLTGSMRSQIRSRRLVCMSSTYAPQEGPWELRRPNRPNGTAVEPEPLLRKPVPYSKSPRGIVEGNIVSFDYSQLEPQGDCYDKDIASVKEEQQADALAVDCTLEEATSQAFHGLSKERIKALIHEKWPLWSKNEYYILAACTGARSKFTSVPCPSPDEAAEILVAWALTCKKKERVRGSRAQVKEPLVKGLVECLRPSGSGKRLPGAPYPLVLEMQPRSSPSGSTNLASSSLLHAPSMPQRLSANALASAIIGLGEIGGARFFTTEMNEICSRLPEVSFRDSNKIYLTIRRLRASRHWTEHLSLFEEAMLRIIEESSELSKESVKDIALVAHALVYLGHTPHELFTILELYVVEFWTWDAAALIAWSLAISMCTTNHWKIPLIQEFLRGVEAHAADYVQGNGVPTWNLPLCTFGMLFFTLQRKQPEEYSNFMKTPSPELENLVQMAYREWKEVVRTMGTVISKPQRYIAGVVESLGYEIALECIIHDLPVDIALFNEKLVIEVDGPHHFARNKHKPVLGNSLWKKRLLEARGWAVININIEDWRKVRKSRRKAFMTSLIETELKKRL